MVGTWQNCAGNFTTIKLDHNKRYKIVNIERCVQKLHFTDSVPKLVLSEVDGDLNTVTKDILDRGYHIANG